MGDAGAIESAEGLHLNRSKSYGSWTIVVDVAGRVAKERTVPILTVSAVAIPGEKLDRVSQETRAAFPGSNPKWSVGGTPFLRTVLKIVEEHKLPVVVLRIGEVGTEVWRTFWDEGQQLFKQLNQEEQGEVGFTKSAHIARSLLCSLMFSRTVVHILNLRKHKMPGPGQRSTAIDLHVVHDADVQQVDTIEIIRGGLNQWARSLAPRLGLKPTVDIVFEGTKAQPLVLLADYIAGAFYVTDPDSNRVGSDVHVSNNTDEIAAILGDFRQRHGPLLRLDQKAFSETYPMTLEEGQLIRRRKRLWDEGEHRKG